MRSSPGHALRPDPWCVLFVLAEPLLCGGRNRCLSRTCENKISIVRLGGRGAGESPLNVMLSWFGTQFRTSLRNALLAAPWAPLLSGTCVAYHEGVFGQERSVWLG